MKILMIELENFASHLHSKVDLTDVVSATVSGNNGSGKSTAFVDAPLWALFGKCRAEPDVIMTHDQLRMSVTLDFSLDGQVYRVIRTRSRQTKAGKTELQFLARKADSVMPNIGGHEWTPVGGHKITETQDAIKSVLNADYELCVNTNFLIQGKADKFSTALAAERKAILAQVLNLGEYAGLRTLANKKTAQTFATITELTNQMIPVEDLAEQMFPIAESIKSKEMDLEKCSAHEISFDTQLKAHYEEFAKKESALEVIVGEKEGLMELLNERGKLEGTLGKNQLDQDYYHILIKRKDEILASAEQHTKLTLTFEEKRMAETKITNALLDIEKDIQNLLERKSREDGTLGRVQSELKTLIHKMELILSEKNVKLGKMHDEIAQDIQQGKLLDVVPCFIELQQKCRFTIEAVTAIEGLPTKKTQLGILEQRDFLREQLPEYESDLTLRREQITNLSNTPTMAKLEAIKLTRHEIMVSRVCFTEDLEELQDEMRGIWPTAKMKPELESALKEVEKLFEVAKSQNLMLHKIIKEIEVKESKAVEEQALKDWFQSSQDVGTSLQKKKAFYVGEMQDITEKLGSLRQQKVQAVAAQGQWNEMKERLTDAQTNHDGYTRLYNYYTTIPVMIMEGAVPTLEAATNSILEKISPSGMRIRLETQKALKNSDRLAETLDILVRDVFGEKPYENYSGGEKFRLDLALRFGLSQLLMNRAGSKMETLIIDEGLGSLDQDGLALLRECLSKLESAFGLILVISHVEGIQGTFEQQIMVEKNANGSEIKVL